MTPPTDPWTTLVESAAGRRLLGALGLPTAPALRRAAGPWRELELAGRAFVVAGPMREALGAAVGEALASAGADLIRAEPPDGPCARAARAYSRRCDRDGEGPIDGIVLDATELGAPGELRLVYDEVAPRLRRLGAHGRIVVLAAPPRLDDPAQAAAQAACEGFCRSLAKELGRRGCTVNLLWLDGDATGPVGPVVGWLLSDRAAFVTGQAWAISGLVAQAPADAPRAPRVRPLGGRRGLLTGAAGGIGSATAEALAREGARLWLLDHPGTAERLSELAARLGGVAVPLELRDPATPNALAELGRAAGGWDFVVHNAGITRDKTLAKMDPDRWDRVVEVNLERIVAIDAALDGGALRAGHHAIYMSSVAGIAGNFGQTNYAASKAGLIGYVQARAELLGPARAAAFAIAPGFIETALTAKMPLLVRELGRRACALAQSGVPADVAELVLFLCTPAARGLAGGTLRICGGSILGA